MSTMSGYRRKNEKKERSCRGKAEKDQKVPAKKEENEEEHQRKQEEKEKKQLAEGHAKKHISPKRR